MPALALTCHPSAPCTFVRALDVRLDWLGEDVLALRYRVEGDLDRLRIPAERRSAHADGLWRHTCFEAFVKRGDTPAYLELNFSASGEWALYGFDDYRHGMRPLAPREAPGIVGRRSGDVFAADVRVHLGGVLDGRAHAGPLRLGVAAVLEDTQGQLYYWALAHPSERPDFHHADSFTLSLAQPE